MSGSLETLLSKTEALHHTKQIAYHNNLVQSSVSVNNSEYLYYRGDENFKEYQKKSLVHNLSQYIYEQGFITIEEKENFLNPETIFVAKTYVFNPEQLHQLLISFGEELLKECLFGDRK